MAAFDLSNPEAIVSPGGVGFDINCGVRLIRTNLSLKDVLPVKEKLTQTLFDHIPVGVGSKGIIPMDARALEEALEMGMDWSLRQGTFSFFCFLYCCCGINLYIYIDKLLNLIEVVCFVFFNLLIITFSKIRNNNLIF